MTTYIYTIVMDTQLGQRNGKILLNIDGKRIEGILSILGNEEPIQGELTNGGFCKLRGRFITRIRKVEYTAKGYFDDIKIDLILHGCGDDFHVRGTAILSEERGNTNV